MSTARRIASILLPNLLHPVKLVINFTNPIGAWCHTKHQQVPFGDSGEVWVVLHYFLGRLVTVDVVAKSEWRRGIWSWLAQIFHLDFYAGHLHDPTQVFRLIDRTYVHGGELDIEQHVTQVLADYNERDSRRAEITENRVGWSGRPQPAFVCA